MKPTIVCLCGSTRFKQEFVNANFRETMAGRIVLSVGSFGQFDGDYPPTPAEKARLDELHLSKIDISDEVLVIDGLMPWCAKCEEFRIGFMGCRGECAWSGDARLYIGDSTRREVAYAEAHGKRIRWLSKEMAIAISNVQLYCPSCRRGARIGRSGPTRP